LYFLSYLNYVIIIVHIFLRANNLTVDAYICYSNSTIYILITAPMSIPFCGKDLPSNRCSGVAAAVRLACVISHSKYWNIIYTNIIFLYCNDAYNNTRYTTTTTKSQYVRVSLGFTWNSHVGSGYNSRTALNRKWYIMVYIRYIPTIL